MANNIKFDVDLNVKKEGLNNLKQALQEIQKISTSQFASMNNNLVPKEAQRQLNEVKAAATEVEKALKNAFNVDLGTLNIAKFGEELRALDINNIYNQFSKVGSIGNTAFRNLTTQIVSTNMQLKETNHVLDQMATTMANTVRWGITSSIMNSFTGAVQQAYGYVKNLDGSLNDIRIVTGKSADEMARFAEIANDSAQKLGAGTTDYTRAALIYYQQGLADSEAQARAETTLKAANVTGQSAQAVSDQLTAVWNGYKVSAEETELYVDKLAAVAASTASDLEELSTGMSKVASAAANMGVDVDQLNAQLATIISVTRQAPESVGTALRSIYARMSQLKADGTDEFGITLGNYTEQMKSMGIEVLDQTGNLRDMGDVIEEVATKWDGWTEAQRNAAAQAMAGTRQYNNLVALFDNWDMYTEALETSQNAMGTLQEQQDIYMESTAAHLQQVRTAFEGVADSILDGDTINVFADALTFVFNRLEDFIDTAGGGGQMLIGIFGSLAQVFSKQIASGISTFINNMKIADENAEALQAHLESINLARGSEAYQNDEGVRYIVDMADAMTQYYSVLSEGEINASNSLVKQAADAKVLQLQWEENKQKALEYAQLLARTNPERNGNGNLYTLNDLRPDSGSFYGSIINDLNQVNAMLENVEKNVNKVSGAFSNWDRQAGDNKLNAQFKSLTQSIEDTYNVMQRLDLNPKLVPAVKRFEDQLNNLGITAGMTGEQIQQALIDAFKNGNLDKGGISRLLNQMRQIGAVGEKEMGVLQFVLNMTDEEVEKLNQDVDTTKAALDRLNEANQTKATIMAVTNLIGAASQLSFSLNSLIGLTEVWGDEGLSAGEKWSKTFNQLLMTAPALAQSIFTISQSIIPLAKVHPILVAIAAAAVGVSAIFAYLGRNFKSSAEQANESVKKYTETKGEVEDLTTELDNCRKKLQELYDLADQRTLSIAEQDELANLQAQTAELQAQLTLKQALAAEQGRQAAQDVKTAYEAGDYDKYNELQGQTVKVDDFHYANMLNLKDEFGQGVAGRFFDEGFDAENDFAAYYDAIKQVNKDLAEIPNFTDIIIGDEEAFDDWNQKLINTINKYQDKVTDLQNEDNITEDIQAQINNYNNLIEQLRQIQSQGSEIYGQQTSELISDLAEGYQTAKEALPALIQENYAGINDEVIAQLQSMIKQYLDQVGLFAQQANNVWASIIPDQDTLDKLKDAINLKDFEEASTKDFEDNLIKVFDNVGLNGEEAFTLLEELANSLGLSLFDLLEHLMTQSDLTFAKIEEDAKAFQGKTEDDNKGDGTATGGTTENKPLTPEDIDLENIYKDLKKQFQDMDLGETIDASVYEKLGEEMQQYFMDMQNGTYMLIDSGESFKKTAEGVVKAAALAEMRQAANRANLIGSYDFEDLSTKATMIPERSPGGKPVGTAAGAPLQGAEDFATTATQDTDKVREQIELVRLLGSATEEQMQKIAEFESQLAEGHTLTAEQLKDLALIVAEQGPAYDEATRGAEDLNAALAQAEMNYALNLDSMKALDQAYNEGTISAQTYAQAALALNEKLDLQNLDPQELKEYSDYLKDNADAMEDVNDEMSDFEAQTMAKTIMKMNDGIEELKENFDDWSDMLKNSQESSEEYADAMNGMIDAVANLLDVSKEYVDNDFITENLDLISQAAQGSGEAIDELRAKMADDIIARIMLDHAGFIQDKDAVLSTYNTLKANLPDIEVGASIDSGPFIDALNTLVEQTGATVADVNALCDGLGFEASYASEPQPTTYQVPTYHVETQTDPETGFISGMDVVPGEMVTLHGSADAYALDINSENSGAPAPKITGVTRKPGGSYNNYSPSNAGGSGGGKGGGGGGGGGKKGKTYEPKKVDVDKKRSDRYHDVNLKLDKITRQYEKLVKIGEKLTGKELLKNLDKQLKNLDKQIKLINRRIKLEKQEAKELRKDLTKEGFKFDDEGYITNYNKKLDKLYKRRANLQEKYNNTASEEGQKAIEKQIENIDKKIKKWEELTQRYDEVKFTEIPDDKELKQELKNQKIETKIAKFNYTIEVRIDWSEAIRDYNEFKEKVDKDFFEPKGKDGKNLFEDREGTIANANRALADYKSFYDDGTGTGGVIQHTTEHLGDILSKLNDINTKGKASVYSDNKEKLLEDLDTYQEQLMDNLEELEDLEEEIHDDYLDLIDEATEAFDDQVDTYEYINDMLEHDMNVMGLLYGDEAYAQMVSYYDQMEKNNNQELDFLKKRAAYAKEMYETETDPEAKEKWKEEWLDAQSEVNSKFEEQLELILDKYTNAVNLAFQELNDKLSGGLGMDFLGKQWDLMETYADEYLDTVNSIYGIQQLQSKYENAIDSTDDVAMQNKLRDIMESELAILRERDHLSQYDLDRANKRYEIALKQMALEDAQQNKSKLRLRRDSQGNYSYQFVEDQEETDKLRDELATLKNELYNMDLEKYKDNLNKIYEYNQQYQEDIIELELETQQKLQAIRNDSTLSEEERAQKEKEILENQTEQERQIRERYEQLINQLVGDNLYIRENLRNSAAESLKETYKDNEEAFRNMTGHNLQEFLDMDGGIRADMMDVLVPAWDSGLQHMTDEITKEGGLEQTYQSTFEKLKKATEEYQASVSAAAEAAGVNLKELTEGYDANAEAIKTLVQDNDALINKYRSEIDYMRSLISQLEELKNKYDAARQAALDMIDAAQRAKAEEAKSTLGNTPKTTLGVSSTETKLKDKDKNEPKKALEDLLNNQNKGNKGNKSNSGSGSKKRTDKENYGVAIAIWNGGYGWGNDPQRSQRLKEKGFDVNTIRNIVNNIVNPAVKSGGWENRWYGINAGNLSQYAYSRFLTGGYTGKWGPEGKLAVLHEKELVLNKQDTQNILDAVNVVRSMSGILNSLSNSMNGRIAGMLGMMHMGSGLPNGNQAVEQTVHITAEFPSVRESTEIETALNNLVNRASQYAFKNKP